MGGISGGRSSGSSSSASETASYGYNISNAGSSSEALNVSEQNIAGYQQPYLEDIAGQAQALAAGQADMGERAQGLVDQVGLGGAGGDFLNTLRSMGDPSAQIAEQTGALRRELGSMFSNELMPGIASAANAAGGLGGGRQAVLEGQAMGDIADAYAQGRSQIVGQANQQALGAARSGIGASEALYNLGLAPGTAQWAPLSQYAQLVGGPTVLGSSLGLSNSDSFAESIAEDMSEGWSTSRGKNSSFNVGLKLGA